MNTPAHPCATLLVREVLLLHVPESDLRDDFPWIRVRTAALDPGLRSGWKLHLSATPASLAPLLRAVVPLLAAAGVAFKTTRDAETLEQLNDGRYGPLQAGKAITVYPPDEAAAAALARALAAATRGMPAPPIATDLRFDADSPVFFRFGPYDARLRIDLLGHRRRLLAHPELGDIDDSPEDPLAGLVPQHLPVLPPADHLAFLRDAYQLLRVLGVSAKGAVLLAVARDAPASLLVIKTARRFAACDVSGRDAVWGLRHEARMMAQLSGLLDLDAPQLRESPDALALVRPYCPGHSLWERATAPDGATPAARREMLATLRALAALVARLHASGVVARDLSPTNVQLASPHLLDLELFHVLADVAPPYRRGTPGFYDPQQPRAAAPRPADDLFALRALLCFATTGLHPAQFPDDEAPPTLPAPAAARLALRWPSLAPQASDFLAQFESACLEVGDALDAPEATPPAAALVPPSPQLLWEDLRASLTAVERGIPFEAAQVYDGLAGLLLCAIEYSPTYLLDRIGADVLRAGARAALAASADIAQIPGFYFGAPGIALAALATGELLDERALRSEARAAFAFATAETSVPDVCHGLAGYALACVAGYRASGEEGLLALAIDAADRLAPLRQRGPDDQVYWPWPQHPDAGSLAGAPLLGYGHGVAGVAAALLEVFAATGHAPARAAAEDGIATLVAGARPVPNADEAVWWAHAANDEACWNAWCHGTPGVLKALATARRIVPQSLDPALLLRAARGVVAAGNPGFCLCHGVASRVDALADAALAAPEEVELHALAQSQAALLAALPLARLHAAALEPPGHDPAPRRGLMTGPLGAWRALAKATGALPPPAASFLP